MTSITQPLTPKRTTKMKTKVKRLNYAQVSQLSIKLESLRGDAVGYTAEELRLRLIEEGVFSTWEIIPTVRQVREIAKGCSFILAAAKKAPTVDSLQSSYQMLAEQVEKLKVRLSNIEEHLSIDENESEET